MLVCAFSFLVCKPQSHNHLSLDNFVPLPIEHFISYRFALSFHAGRYTLISRLLLFQADRGRTGTNGDHPRFNHESSLHCYPTLTEPLHPVMKDEVQFRPLNFTQKFLNTREKILWRGELLSCQCCHHVPEKPEVRMCQAGTVKRMRYSNNVIFSEKVLRGLCTVNATVVKVQT
jgi:hypothetical protein